MPYKKPIINTFQDLIDFINENDIANYQFKISGLSGFESYKIIGIDLSYSGECAQIDIKEVKE